jgi:hypothetical protein
MILIPRGNQPDCGQHICRGRNTARAVGNIDGWRIPLPFWGLKFNLLGRFGGNDQLTLRIIALN